MIALINLRPCAFLKFIASIYLSLWVGLALAGDAMQIAVDPAPLVISTANGPVSFDVEVANTDVERAAGLMFRENFSETRAMLFDFGQVRPVSMWMKNTPSPLDMLFIDENGIVVGVTANTTPQSLDVISSSKPVRYVLEINAGQAAKKNIITGARATHPLIIIIK